MVIANTIAREISISEEREKLRDFVNIPKPKYLNDTSYVSPENVEFPEGTLESCIDLVKYSIENPSPVLGGDCLMIPVSGGIDSSTVFLIAHIAMHKSERKIPIIPVFFQHDRMTSMEKEEKRIAERLAYEHGYDLKEIDITSELAAMNQHTIVGNPVYRPITELENVARVRNIVLQGLATNRRAITICTANALERWLNHYTTFDYRGNIALLNDLLKTEVRKLGKLAGVPDYILARPKVTSELQQTYENGVGAGEGFLDAVVYWILKGKTPDEVAQMLGHDPEWVQNLYEKRMIMQQVRQDIGKVSNVNLRNYRDTCSTEKPIIPQPSELYAQDLRDSKFIRQLDECRQRYMPRGEWK